MSRSVRVLDPRMPPNPAPAQLAERRPLAGQRVVLLDNGKLGDEYGPYGAIFEIVAAELERAAPRVSIERELDDLNVGTPVRLEELAGRLAARRPAAVVVALADWGVSQPTTLLAAALEQRGVPVTVVATPPGSLHVRAVAARVVPGLPVVPLPLLRVASRDEVRVETKRLFPEIHTGITASPQELRRRFAEIAPPPAPTKGPSGMIELTGDDPSEELTRLLAEEGLGDGFPLVPPTHERVEAFLAAAPLEPDVVVWPEIAPRPCPVTARDAAVVAVAAGCEPRWAPVVYAALDAMAAPEFRLFQAAITTHPGGTLVLVSGPRAAELGLASGRGSLGPGFPANARIGRAVALSYSFLLGVQPGGSDLTSQGSPAEYSYCCAENLAESPWPGLHADLGFPGETTVTVVKCEGPHSMIDTQSLEPEHLLDTFASTTATLGGNSAYAPSAQTLLLLNPEHAALLAAAGWDKSAIRSYLFDRARHRRADLLGRGQARMWPAWFGELEWTPVVTSADDLLVAVVGGAGPASQVVVPWGMGRGATRPIRVRP